MWNHQIDLNLIYVILNHCRKDVNLAIQVLFAFEQWKFRNNNEQNYKKRVNEFLERRCCNHNVNLFFIFVSQIDKEQTATERATLDIDCYGLPFVEKDKQKVVSFKQIKILFFFQKNLVQIQIVN
ncbi:hypothetical protein RFI_37950 [Reticulomyxa filosa]|uniref:Uncharacterized protein n=1 Tax=Reticulomyxa filosa TaxID=46433 RepID=X6LDS9_RETFI|nr:hypothetical protein RFI_37950 [Reticulomyxa filosa]|eukprot:ETN99520.1 hypothetical protein RFI_37950 [Reticulomyxa filosa]